MFSKDDPIQLWQHLHGASAHFPIALLFVGAAFDYGSIVFKQPTWRHVGFWCLMCAALISVFTVITGLSGVYGWFGIKDVWQADSILKHRNIALITSGVAIALALWRAIRRDRLQGAEWAVFLVALLAAVAGIGYTGFLGAYVQRGY